MDGAGGYLRQSGQLPLQFLLQARNACHCCRLFLVLSPLFNIDINPCRYFDVCSFPADSYGKVRLPMGLLCVKTDHNTLIEKTVKLRTSRLISMQYEHRPLRVVRGRWECSKDFCLFSKFRHLFVKLPLEYSFFHMTGHFLMCKYSMFFTLRKMFSRNLPTLRKMLASQCIGRCWNSRHFLQASQRAREAQPAAGRAGQRFPQRDGAGIILIASYSE